MSHFIGLRVLPDSKFYMYELFSMLNEIACSVANDQDGWFYSRIIKNLKNQISGDKI